MSRREWAETYHGYMRLPIEERREAVRELSEQGMTAAQIGDTLGVTPRTIHKDRHPESLPGPRSMSNGLEPEQVQMPQPDPSDFAIDRLRVRFSQAQITVERDLLGIDIEAVIGSYDHDDRQMLGEWARRLHEWAIRVETLLRDSQMRVL
jgi:transposase-like protein